MRESIAGLAALVAGLALLLGGGCRHTEDGGAVRSGADEPAAVYFRSAALEEMSDQALPEYTDAEPGDSELLARAFEGAPPQIPHSGEDMFPITIGSNECIECHHPDNVASEWDRPIPESHFEHPLMAPGDVDEATRWKVAGYRRGEDIAGARYQCHMCHAPQARNVSTPRNRLGKD